MPYISLTLFVTVRLPSLCVFHPGSCPELSSLYPPLSEYPTTSLSLFSCTIPKYLDVLTFIDLLLSWILKPENSLTPYQINVAEVAAALGPDTKVNTVSKRLSNMKKKYNINIACTTVGAAAATNGEKKPTKSGSGATTATAPSSPAQSATATTTTGQKVLSGRVTKGGGQRAAAGTKAGTGAKGGRGKKKTNGKNGNTEAETENTSTATEIKKEGSDDDEDGDLAAVPAASKAPVKTEPRDNKGSAADEEEEMTNANTNGNIEYQDAASSANEADELNNDTI